MTDVGALGAHASARPGVEAHALTLDEIRCILISGDQDVRDRFQEEFPGEVEELANELHATCARLRLFTKSVSGDMRAAWVEMLLFAAFNSVLTSAHLLLSSLLIPSGNLMRQFGEACATALLTSHRAMDTLRQLKASATHVSFDDSIRRVRKKENRQLLDVIADGWAKFEEITGWYDSYSHCSALSVASLSLFDRPGMLMVGAEFDRAKVDVYRRELRLRISAAERLRDVITACETHVQSAQAARIGILAFGSLRDDPGEEITEAMAERRPVTTPFPVEFARYSCGTRGGAPTLVPVDTGGMPVDAELLILDDDISLRRAKDILWRRETRQGDPHKRYADPKEPGPNQVLVRELGECGGCVMVIHTDFAPEGKVPDAEPMELARHAVRSVSRAEAGRDGITYLLNAKRAGITTPKMPAYEAEVLGLTGATTLEEALVKAPSAGLPPAPATGGR